MARLVRVFLLHFLVSLQQRALYGFDSCEIAGSARLNQTGEHMYNKSQYQLLQVCLFGHWSYVCGNNGFGNTLRGTRNMNVTLYQLGCVNGDVRTFSADDSTPGPVYMTSIFCTGVERRLADCSYRLRMTTCNKKVGVHCNEFGNYTCRNGDLQINELNNIVEICVSDLWKKLCPNLWRLAQAEVACRQLNPGRMITNATATAVDGVYNPDYLMTQFLCIGNEAQLTYCTSVSIDVGSVANTDLCNANQPQLVGGLVCETGLLSVASTTLVHPTVNVTHASAVLQCPLTATTHTQSCTTTLVISTTAFETAPCSAQTGFQNNFLDASPVNTTPGSSSPLPWVGGGIIGAVLSAAILVTVLAAVCLLKRKRTHSQHKIVDDNHIPDQMYESVDQKVAYDGMHSRVQLVPASSKICESASIEDKLQVEENICYTSSVHESATENVYSYAKWTTPNSCAAKLNTSQRNATSEYT